MFQLTANELIIFSNPRLFDDNERTSENNVIELETSTPTDKVLINAYDAGPPLEEIKTKTTCVTTKEKYIQCHTSKLIASPIQVESSENYDSPTAKKNDTKTAPAISSSSKPPDMDNSSSLTKRNSIALPSTQDFSDDLSSGINHVSSDAEEKHTSLSNASTSPSSLV